ncbi:MAG: hypothetical protein ACYDIC_03150 [Desulfobaccales bacterium]
MCIKENDVHDELAKNLGQLLLYTTNEAILIANMEEFFAPRPAKLAYSEDEINKVTTTLENVAIALGGFPKLIVTQEDEHPPTYDTFPNAAIDEILSTFHSCRYSVCKTHLFRIAFPIIKLHPDFFTPPIATESVNGIITILEKRFWEEAEIAFIRLASYWDRLGQLLDFAFFNIRQYERDGFPAVIQRIWKNFVPVFPEIGENESWHRLWNFSKLEDREGLVWLLRRRNLLIHSLHLRPVIEQSQEDPIFASLYNHLEESVRKKLKPGEPQQELESLHTHLSLAATHFYDAIELCEFATQVHRKTWGR